jgi:hypothetical protein
MRSIFGALVLFALAALVIGLVANFASAAGGSIGNNTQLGGGWKLDGVSMSSYAYTNDAVVNGSFSLRMDADRFSFDYADWSFYTQSSDTSYWYATCNLHGKRNSYEEHPQNEYWSQSYSADVVHMSADMNFNCYNLYDSNIDSLLAQLASLQGLLDTNPSPETTEKVLSQIQSIQTMIGLLQQNNEDVLSVSGNFSLQPSKLDGSNFSFWNTTDYSYSYPNGYDQEPVITELPAWSAEYRLSGHFVAPTLGEAQAMGAQFVQTQDVPEPTSFVLMLCGAAVAVIRRRRRG